MACAIRGNNDIKGIKLPGEPGGKELEAKISMFADDTQLFNKENMQSPHIFCKEQIICYLYSI
jgi:hypothetical protein